MSRLGLWTGMYGDPWLEALTVQSALLLTVMYFDLYFFFLSLPPPYPNTPSLVFFSFVQDLKNNTIIVNLLNGA